MPIMRSYTLTVTTEVVVKASLDDAEELTPDKAVARGMEPFLAIPHVAVIKIKVVPRG